MSRSTLSLINQNQKNYTFIRFSKLLRSIPKT